MSTFNILALSSFKDFAKDILELKGKYPQIILDISYLKDPSYLCADFITKNEYYLLDEILIFLNENKSTNHKGFTQYEINKFLRVYDWIKSDKNKDHLVQQRSDFYNFIKEFDKRKGFDFSHTFPALASFFQLCKKAQAFVSLKF